MFLQEVMHPQPSPIFCFNFALVHVAVKYGHPKCFWVCSNLTNPQKLSNMLDQKIKITFSPTIFIPLR